MALRRSRHHRTKLACHLGLAVVSSGSGGIRRRVDKSVGGDQKADVIQADQVSHFAFPFNYDVDSTASRAVRNGFLPQSDLKQ